ncbi:hypothetical protein D0A37_08205 [Microcoleus vaginatus HSN003]|nr:hypothetical protein D0A37_08205 [Microcoleus vaginatus HSN003]
MDVDLREASLFCTGLSGTDLTTANLMGATFQVHTEEDGLIFYDTILPRFSCASGTWRSKRKFPHSGTTKLW